MRRSDVFWDDGPEYDKPDEPDQRTQKLIRDYERETEVIKSQAEMLASILKGMRQ